MPDSLDAAVRNFLRDVLPAELPVTVACSGGADSLALAVSVLGAVGPERAAAVTVDHQLQPGSTERARSTATQLLGLGYAEVNVRTVAVGTAGGPEAAARAARYAALLPDPGAPRAVLLGHTLDDQAETVLLGLARGSGPTSIAGMAPWRPPWGRPLLDIRRSETEAYCRAAGQGFWSDPHNLDPRFTRVRLRREVLPLLENVLGGGVAPALARTARLMADDLRALDQLAAQLLAETMDPGGTLRLAEVRAAPPALRRRVLLAWCSAVGAGRPTAEHLFRLDAQVMSRRPNGTVRLPGAVDAVTDHQSLAAVRVT